jgi:preprotein translocase subunit YajC
MSLLAEIPSVLAQQTGPGPQGGLVSLLPFVLIFAAMYFLMIAPQRKKAKEHAKMLEALSTGDEVITAGGIYGEITNKKDDRFVIRIADGTKVEIGKAFIHALVKKAA